MQNRVIQEDILSILVLRSCCHLKKEKKYIWKSKTNHQNNKFIRTKSEGYYLKIYGDGVLNKGIKKHK